MLVAKNTQTLNFKGTNYKLIEGEQIPDGLLNKLSSFQESTYFEDNGKPYPKKVANPNEVVRVKKLSDTELADLAAKKAIEDAKVNAEKAKIASDKAKQAAKKPRRKKPAIKKTIK